MITNVLQYLARASEAFADKPALSDAACTVTYGQLRLQAERIGTRLAKTVGARNRPVFVCIDRTAASVAAFLGVAVSGNFYVPVDLHLPPARLRSIFETMRPVAVLAPAGDARAAQFAPCPILPFEDETAPRAGILDDAIRRGLDTDPLYCIFTSGSTGVPKGVLVSHRSVIDMVEQFSATFGFSPDTVFGNQAPFDFDVSVKDLYNALRNGAHVHILETKLFMTPKRLIERINTHRVNTLIWAASAMKIVSMLKTFDTIVPAHLRLVMFSGEVLPGRIFENWREHLPDVDFVNLYGPTEITCNCTYYKLPRAFDASAPMPIGAPFANCDVFLLDGDRPVRDGTGEICVKGSCLALGYYANPAETARAFCQNPLNPHYPERIYRTGDLGRYDADGRLVYVGRADSQVKHMGHRIELGEVEAAAHAIPEIADACCLYDTRREKLCLFYEAPEQCDDAVYAALKGALPGYMVPGRLLFLPALPHNRTGKIDRALLRQQYLENEG